MSDSLRLHTLAIEGSRSGPKLLITAGVHGDEFTPMAAVRKLARRVEPDALRGTLRLVPVVNEAAYLRGERTAEDGHDLARVCPGNPDGSVTLRTAFALSQLIGETDYYIDLHTGSATLAVLPMTGYTLHTDARILERQREMASAFNLPVVWGTTPTLDGRSLSVARDTGVPAIYAEYLGSGVCDPEGVEAYVSGSLNVMAQLGMIDRKPPESQVELIVEDDGPQSGHMQVQNNSPVTGFFEPTVCLGQTIETGSLIGTVVDVAGSEAAKIQAQYDGIVLALRTFPRVLQGDSVAVIMNTAGNRTSWSGGLA